jgi:D-alanyl-D-alanine dipeptidase
MRRPAHILCALLSVGSAWAEPIEHHLVDVATIQPPPLEEIRYATRYNFTGEVLYPAARAYVHSAVATALAKVQGDLAKEGLGLKIYDGYRPLSATSWRCRVGSMILPRRRIAIRRR